MKSGRQVHLIGFRALERQNVLQIEAHAYRNIKWDVGLTGRNSKVAVCIQDTQLVKSSLVRLG